MSFTHYHLDQLFSPFFRFMHGSGDITPFSLVSLHMSQVLTRKSALSLKVNHVKSVLTSTPQADFLGLSLNMIANIILLSDRWVTTIRTCLVYLDLGLCICIH